MGAIDDLKTLLKLPPPQESRRWLESATANLEGFRPQPEVLRHSLQGERAAVEVRRWSKGHYLALSAPNARGQRVLLSQDGILVLSQLDRIRTLRDRPDDRMYDEIYSFSEVEQPTPEQCRAIQDSLIPRLASLGYTVWDRLTESERDQLVTYPAGWEDAAQALACLSGPERIRTLERFLSTQAHPSLSARVREAAETGLLRPGPEVLAWLLARPDWNFSPSLVRLARSAAEDDPKAAWNLRTHPNPQVRLRLVDLVVEPVDWLGWLVEESHLGVRERLRQIIEQRNTPSQIVDALVTETDPTRREALGWLLVNWSRRIDSSQDWRALNRALQSKLGSENRLRLKRKLAESGRLSLRSRWLG